MLLFMSQYYDITNSIAKDELKSLFTNSINNTVYSILLFVMYELLLCFLLINVLVLLLYVESIFRNFFVL